MERLILRGLLYLVALGCAFEAVTTYGEKPGLVPWCACLLALVGLAVSARVGRPLRDVLAPFPPNGAQRSSKKI